MQYDIRREEKPEQSPPRGFVEEKGKRTSIPKFWEVLVFAKENIKGLYSFLLILASSLYRIQKT